MTLKIALFGSGKGTSIEFIINSINSNLLDSKKISINYIITKSNSNIIKICEKYNFYNIISLDIPNQISSSDDRKKFETKYKFFWTGNNIPDVILLLGWNYILTTEILEHFNSYGIKVLNLHSSLPGTFIGNNCIEKNYNSYIKNQISVMGSMIYECTGELDRGKVIDTIKFPINTNSLENFTQQVKYHEKILIYNVLQNLSKNHIDKDYKPFYLGNERDISNIGYGLLLMITTDRISAFNRHLTDIPLKGAILNSMSAWWFKKTRHIIDNHYLSHSDRFMVVKKCKPIKLEIVVRGYSTGIWKRYNQGERNIYGLDFMDCLSKNKKLEKPVITPTTKGKIESPLTKEQIITDGYLNVEQTEFIYEKAVELFNFGSIVANSKGLILVDTKYEFGFYDNKIILMDELHTCDSSRYWNKNTYLERFSQNLEPEKFDKDCIRDYIKLKYTDEEIETFDNFIIPAEVVENVTKVYQNYHRILTQNDLEPIINISRKDYVDMYLSNYHKKMVVIFAGSTCDKEHVDKIKYFLKEKNIYSIVFFRSAHKNIQEVLNILIKFNNQKNRSIVYVTVAGRSNDLSCVVACNTHYPVIACPPFKDKMDMFTNINSTLQCPSKVPVMTCLEPCNVAMAIQSIFDLCD